MITTVFLAAAILFQAVAAILALSYIRLTGRALAWIFVSAALCLMVLRRILPFVSAVSWRAPTSDPIYEFIGMMLSGCMATGVALIKPIFKRMFESERELAESERRFRSYFELPIVGFATVSSDRRWISMNDRLCEMFAAPREDIVGTLVDDRTVEEYRAEEADMAARTLAGDSEGYVIDKRLIRGPAGDSIWVSQAARLVRGKDQAPSYFVLIIQDISERMAYERRLRGSVEEKEVLLRELYHRTKNNMQVICSLLNLQVTRCKDPETAEGIRLTEERIQSMSLVHEKLYRSRDLSHIDLAEYIGDLVELLMNGNLVDPRKILVATRLTAIKVPIDIAIPCGLILHELISNSLKHAFPDGRMGRIDIRLEGMEGRRVRIGISDDGVGIEPDVDLRECDGMGMKTVFALAEQIEGTLSFSTERGVACELDFPNAPLNESEEAVAAAEASLPA